jgi:hypothetical protein
MHRGDFVDEVIVKESVRNLTNIYDDSNID